MIFAGGDSAPHPGREISRLKPYSRPDARIFLGMLGT
jgi:hypothetical protein